MKINWVCPYGHKFELEEHSADYESEISTLAISCVLGTFKTKNVCPQCLVDIINANVPELKKEG